MIFFKSLAEKITQLEDLTLKKEKFIQSNKMIVKFREDQIMRLERLQKEARGHFLPEEQDRLLSELRDEIQTLREQVSASRCRIPREELYGTCALLQQLVLLYSELDWQCELRDFLPLFQVCS